MSYEVKKGLLGGLRVFYKCPHCGGELESKLEEAGQVDKCPHCTKRFTVPGKKELDAKRDAEESERRAAEQRRQRAAEAHAQAQAEARAHARAEEVRRAELRKLCPYEYHMVQIPPTITVSTERGQEAAQYLASVVEQNVRQGWEFFRMDPISVAVPAGCLAALLGQSDTFRTYHVVTFRRPVLG